MSYKKAIMGISICLISCFIAYFLVKRPLIIHQSSNFGLNSLLSIDKQNNYLAATNGGVIDIWNTKSWKHLLSIEQSVNSPISWSDDGKYFAASRDMDNPAIYQSDGKIFQVFPDFEDVSDIEWMGNSQIIILYNKIYVSILDINTTISTTTFILPKKSKMLTRLNNEDSKLLITTFDDTVQFFDILNNTLITEIDPNQGDNIIITVSSDDKLIATGGSDGSIKIWDMDGILQHIFNGHKDRIRTLAFTPDMNYIISGSGKYPFLEEPPVDSSIRVWSLQDGSSRVLDTFYRSIDELTITPDGKYLIVAVREDIFIYNLQKMDLDEQ